MFGHWLGEVFSSPDGLTLLAIVGRSAFIYVVVVAAMRLLGTRELGRLNAYDFVLVVVVANSVQNALVGGDNTLVGGLVSAATLFAMNWLYTELVHRVPALQRRLVGEPVVLINDGHVRRAALRKQGVTTDELHAALREHGLTDPKAVRLAVLEVDGDISVVPGGARVHRTHRRMRER
jgi:uncharacterized membrane protein YcaP (DUF421 family)